MEKVLYLLPSYKLIMAKKVKVDTSLSTEEKIKEAARTVFTQKGYAATKTRDIAEEAGINLALLNYYFRSKEKLFELVMLESVKDFFSSLTVIFNDENTEVDKKIELIIDRYIDVLLKEPNFPLFMLSEMQANPKMLMDKLNFVDFLRRSFFYKQLSDFLESENIKLHPIHFIMNIISLVVFPFVGKPVLSAISGLSDEAYTNLMLERKKLIPQWIKAALMV